MSSLPKNVSESFKRLNPHIYAKEVMPSGTARADIPARSTAVTTGERASEANTRQFVIHTDPVPAPRMTRRDKWLVGAKRRPIVQRYFDFRDALRAAIGDLPVVPDELHVMFHFEMPESWSKKRRQEMHGQPHRQRPDRDNCEKAIMDSLFLEDGGVWKGSSEKRWSVHGRVELTMIWGTERNENNM